MGEIVTLGEVRCPSGQLVIVDGGMLGMWSGSRPPNELDPRGLGIEDPDLLAEVAGAADYTVVGPDAERAGASFQVRPGRYHYDIPASRRDDWVERFGGHCREHGWMAGLERSETQVSHRERARRCAVERQRGFSVFGLPAVAVDGLPGRAVRVEAERSNGPWDGWSQMIVRVCDAPVASTVDVGVVGVDAARLAFADVHALDLWRHEEPLDGLADVAFWGADAPAAAQEFTAEPLTTSGDEGSYGWTGLPIRSALRRAMTVQAWRDAEPGRGLAVDFRPHSHHWQVMRQVRASDTESGTLPLGDAQILFAMTSWGDGVFPVQVDRDAAGHLLAVRITLAEG
ncbi:hypothetical protein GCM10010169_34490 [Micromonospora fulviviridis]|uniref:hypothetical protein n=1 Tax=Micromonospora fulviviridis TaxID=47860 RepID=UPI0016681D71|nr:hypothetical protein [Micromonospora fulviviridis]GGR87352.1 hypothetical protein GCM10010169_34490 [Micromonospora fulviviridis]